MPVGWTRGFPHQPWRSLMSFKNFKKPYKNAVRIDVTFKKTARKIDISKLLLHSVREWLRFIEFFPQDPHDPDDRQKYRVKMQSQLRSPSKTPREIDISKLFLHSVRECLQFIDFKLPGLQKTVKNTLGVKFLNQSSLPAQFPQLPSPSSVPIHKSQI